MVRMKKNMKPRQENSLNVLVLNGSLKRAPHRSNTEEVARLLIDEMRKLETIDAEIVRLADETLPAGTGYMEGPGDGWPKIAEKMTKADIIIFATPIWWGQRSSLMQRLVERMDSFDEGQVPGGREALLGKVAGIVITGSEDGAQAVMASIMEVLSFMNFTLPPQCATYWVGETGMDPKTDTERRRKNEAVPAMAKKTAQGLVEYAKLLRAHKMVV